MTLLSAPRSPDMHTALQHVVRRCLPALLCLSLLHALPAIAKWDDAVGTSRCMQSVYWRASNPSYSCAPWEWWPWSVDEGYRAQYETIVTSQTRQCWIPSPDYTHQGQACTHRAVNTATNCDNYCDLNVVQGIRFLRPYQVGSRMIMEECLCQMQVPSCHSLTDKCSDVPANCNCDRAGWCGAFAPAQLHPLGTYTPSSAPNLRLGTTMTATCIPGYGGENLPANVPAVMSWQCRGSHQWELTGEPANVECTECPAGKSYILCHDGEQAAGYTADTVAESIRMVRRSILEHLDRGALPRMLCWHARVGCRIV
jgi:hypothetical protein